MTPKGRRPVNMPMFCGGERDKWGDGARAWRFVGEEAAQMSKGAALPVARRRRPLNPGPVKDLHREGAASGGGRRVARGRLGFRLEVLSFRSRVPFRVAPGRSLLFRSGWRFRSLRVAPSSPAASVPLDGLTVRRDRVCSNRPKLGRCAGLGAQAVEKAGKFRRFTNPSKSLTLSTGLRWRRSCAPSEAGCGS